MKSARTSICCGFALTILAAAPASAAREIDAQAASSWADALFQEALAQQRFTGAVMSIVKDGTVILSKGYGNADREAGTPMDPAQTLVRICSVSKTIVATALMQLVDRGAIASLDDPANKYLKRVQLPRYEGEQITLRHLTTHSAGFEDTFFNAATDEIVPTPVDAATLQRLIPRIVRKPGTLSVYSNATAALQGALIEDVTGLTLREYLARNIFAPLGMTRTELNDSPPAPPGAARPYAVYSDGSLQPVEIVAKHPVYAPSGGVYSTAEDLSRFVAAHLDEGRTAAAPILSRASFQTMHTPFRRNHPGLSGLGVQFVIDDINGERVLSHGCGLPGFTSYLVLLPARGVGVFISVVSARGKEPFALLRCCGGRRVEAVAPNFAVRFFYAERQARRFLRLCCERLARDYSGLRRHVELTDLRRGEAGAQEQVHAASGLVFLAQHCHVRERVAACACSPTGRCAAQHDVFDVGELRCIAPQARRDLVPALGGVLQLGDNERTVFAAQANARLRRVLGISGHSVQHRNEPRPALRRFGCEAGAERGDRKDRWTVAAGLGQLVPDAERGIDEQRARCAGVELGIEVVQAGPQRGRSVRGAPLGPPFVESQRPRRVDVRNRARIA